MNPLIASPAASPDQLGYPIPNDPHAVSVCLPTWKSVINYEERDPATLQALQTGYPRFVFHPLVRQLTTLANQSLTSPHSVCLLFPDLRAAREAQHFVERKSGHLAEIIPFLSVFAVATSPEHFPVLQFFWRIAGEGISSRLAADLLASLENSEIPCPRPLTSPPAHLPLRKLLASFSPETSPNHLFLYPSGMAATFAAFRAATATRQHRKTLQLGFPYVDLLRIQQNFGAGVDFPVIDSPASFTAAIAAIEAGSYSAVFCEAPTNPLLTSLDIQAISRACRKSQTLFVADDSIASPYNIDLAPLADIVVSSLTKWISGKGNVIAGQVRISPHSPYATELLAFLGERDGHSRLYDADARVLLENAADFPARISRINSTALAVARFFAAQPLVAQTCYPGIESDSPLIPLLRPDVQDPGFAGLLSVIFRNPKHARTFYDKVAISKGPSFGTDFSLLCPFTLLAHYDELDEVAKHGIPSHLLRFSIGLEPADELIARFQSAFDAIQ